MSLGIPSQYDTNRRIESIIDRIDKTGDTLDLDERGLLKLYTGSGGQGKRGAKGEGVLYEFYTPEFVANVMGKLAWFHGYRGGPVLEPSVGTGRFLATPYLKPEDFVGFEINRYSKRICELLYPEATIHEGYFETAFLQSPRYTSRIRGGGTWLEQYPFRLVIGNPPYGRYRNLYSSYFNRPKMPTMELFFIYYGLQLLEKGGLLLYLTSSNILRSGTAYQSAKREIGKIGVLVDGFRLPPVFRFSKVPADILIFRRT